MLFFWLIVNHGPVGFNPKTFTGPALTILTFAQYLLPLAVLQLYLRVQNRAGTAGRFAMAAALFVLTLATIVGLFVMKFVGPPPAAFIPRAAIAVLMLLVAAAAAAASASGTAAMLITVNIALGFVLLAWYVRE